GTNTTYLSNVVNHYFKCNYKHLLNKYRILHAKHLIDNNECDITELDKRCGFTSRSVFYEEFHRHITGSGGKKLRKPVPASPGQWKTHWERMKYTNSRSYKTMKPSPLKTINKLSF
uniref:helix-turn-helix domain-containing protein n=1 Tax=Phocaeicola massiliensis TaxID=204516 RepID=UPI0022E2F44C